jgi:hypothetical protein
MEAVRTETYKGFEIEICLDSDYQNPFEDWDGEFPLMYSGGRNMSSKDFSNGDIDNYLSGYLSLNQLTKHMGKVLKLIEYSKSDFDSDCPIGEWTKWERQDALKDRLSEWMTESLDNRASFCSEFGVKHYCGSSTGYSQGDWAKVFICWTPEFAKITGHEYKDVTDEGLKGTKKLFDAWAWGDVYGYNIEDLSGGLGSCWGYYGNNLEENGLMEAARDCIDGHLRWEKKQELERQKKRQSKIKAMIKHHVPLQYRVNL